MALACLRLPGSVRAEGPRLGVREQEDEEAGPEDGPEQKGQTEVATSHRYIIYWGFFLR